MTFIIGRRRPSITGRGRRWGFYWWVFLLLLFAACTGDTETEQEGEQTSYAPVRMVGVSRAPLGDSDYGDIRVFLTDGEKATEGLFKYEGTSVWNTMVKLKSGIRTYRLYGYMPDNGTFSRSITDWDDNGAVLHISGLDAITTLDYCVVTGVYQAENATDTHAAERGRFAFEYASNRMNYINLLFDHLFGRVIIKLKTGDDYAALRTIKIKTMQLQLADISKVSADITLKKEEGIDGIAYNITETEAKAVTIRNSELTLSTTPVVACSAQIAPLPALLNKLKLVTTYDVYDKKGNKIAERTATNQLATVMASLEPGKEITLTIAVDPTYLYVLSDADLDNPPFIIEN